MRLFSDAVWGISKNHLKILEAAESLAYSNEWVSESTLKNKTNLKGNFGEFLTDLITMKFITAKGRMYKLSISGHDCLGINTLRKRGLEIMGSNIAIGKESDIYYGVYKGKEAAIKINKLGRTSFQKIGPRELKNNENWFSLNKENCKKEAYFLNLFKGADIPVLLDYDRHVMVMELLQFTSLYKVRVEHPEIVSAKMINFIKRLWELGYVHGDFNEFNIMVNDNDEIKVLDFPQCIPITDPKAAEYLKRDIECVYKYFWRRQFYICDDSPLKDICAHHNIKIEIYRKNEEFAMNPEALELTN